MVEEERGRLLQELVDQVLVCTQCRLHLSRRIAVPGEGPLDADLLWLGEGPGAAEDSSGRPFVGESGRFLRREMEAVGISPGSVYITNVVKCRPAGNRKPRADEIVICTSLYLARQIDLIRPGGVVALGATAAEAILADTIKITHDHGTWHRDYDLTDHEVPVFVTYHPAAALRNDRWRTELRDDLRRLAASKVIRRKSDKGRILAQSTGAIGHD